MGQRLGYFHHIPFPQPEVFEVLPWRTQILRALLQFDRIGFQTARDCRNFIACLQHLLTDVSVSHINGDALVYAQERVTAIGVHPISIDYDQYAHEVDDAVTIRSAMRTQIILGVDRLDYTKGIPERLAAFERLLGSQPDLSGRVSMVQIVVPSREEISEYLQLKLQIELAVGRINGQYGRPDWMPIHYFYRSFCPAELISFYRAADIALVTSLRDGMNLVAKEFCASRVDDRGVLILSEFTGAAEELKCGALMVNPYDTCAVAAMIGSALHMSELEQQIRMERMRSQIRVNNVFEWSRSFLKQCSTPDLVFPHAAFRP
jgi:trehalose-6-phosphate synthase